MKSFTPPPHRRFCILNVNAYMHGTRFVGASWRWSDGTGPTVLDAPGGALGFVDDIWMRPVENIGPGGPDAGKGGKYVFLPPGYDGPLPDTDYFTIPDQHVWPLGILPRS